MSRAEPVAILGSKFCSWSEWTIDGPSRVGERVTSPRCCSAGVLGMGRRCRGVMWCGVGEKVGFGKGGKTGRQTNGGAPGLEGGRETMPKLKKERLPPFLQGCRRERDVDRPAMRHPGGGVDCSAV